MRFKYSISLFLLIAVVNLAAQQEEVKEPEEAIDPIEELASNAMVLTISTNLIVDDVVLWSTQNSRLTIPGRPVGVDIEGSNLKISSQFTPYTNDDNVVLVAQSQVWLALSEENGGVRTLGNIRSLPIHFEEDIIFFPLGTPQPREDMNGVPIIKMEIKVYRYLDYAILEEQE